MMTLETRSWTPVTRLAEHHAVSRIDVSDSSGHRIGWAPCGVFGVVDITWDENTPSEPEAVSKPERSGL